MVYLNPQDRNDLIKGIEEKGEVVDYELILKTKDKSLLYVSTNAHFLFDSFKNPIGIEGFVKRHNRTKKHRITTSKIIN